MFEDLIPEKIIPQPTKDSINRSLVDNIRDKQELIDQLIEELDKRQTIINDMQKEIDYLTDL